MLQRSNKFIAILGSAAALLLVALTWSVANTLPAVLACAFVVVAVALLVALALNRPDPPPPGPTTLRSEQEITLRLESMRDGATAVFAIWSGKYDPDEVKRYFEDERKALKTNERLKITRVINPSVIPKEDERFDYELLQAIHNDAPDRFKLLEDSTLRSYELYLAEYPREANKKAVAVVVLNNTLSERPEVALVLDPQEDQSLEGVVDAVKRWWQAIREDLPEFDPVRLKRWEQIAASYTRLITENANDIEFLTHYSARESEMFANYLRDIQGEDRELSIIEVGCGDGRALLAYIPAEISRHIAYVIGLDYARAMVDAAARSLKIFQQVNTFPAEHNHVLKARTAFFQLNALHMPNYFEDGMLQGPEQLVGAAPSAAEVSIDPGRYATSTKVFCCLLNTIGVIETDHRVAFVEAMLSCLGVNDSLVFTVFAAERFRDEAPKLYGALEEMINTDAREVHFDTESATFQVTGSPGYYSHWFTSRELTRLVDDATDRLEDRGRHFDLPKVVEMGTGGYFVSVRRMG